MTSKKTMKWIVLAIVIGLVGAGGLIAWASPPDASDDVDDPSAEPAVPNPGGVAASVSLPASTPRTPDPRTAIDAVLIATVVVEGGPSFAVIQLATGTRLVREGGDIAVGVRLVQVGRNRIDVEREGIHQEIRLGSNEGTRQQVRPGSTGVASGKEVRARLREDLRARGRL